jgi:hypothetical protein
LNSALSGRFGENGLKARIRFADPNQASMDIGL